MTLGRKVNRYEQMAKKSSPATQFACVSRGQARIMASGIPPPSSASSSAFETLLWSQRFEASPELIAPDLNTRSPEFCFAHVQYFEKLSLKYPKSRPKLKYPEKESTEIKSKKAIFFNRSRSSRCSWGQPIEARAAPKQNFFSAKVALSIITSVICTVNEIMDLYSMLKK